jgi:NADH-quinone oxidoreductase subunit H
LFLLIGGGCGIGTMRVSLAYEKGLMAVLTLGMLLIAALFAIPAVNVLIIGFFWFLFKVLILVYMFIWIRGTFPRFRYDQLMDVGWRYLIPISMGSLIVNGVVLLLTS